MRFEWGEVKRRANLKKHGIDFADLEPLFDGVTLTVPDERFDYGEERFVTLGLLNGLVLVVVHTETGEVIRVSPHARRRSMRKSATSKKSRTDWGRLKKMSDTEIDLSESPELTPEMFARAVVRRGLRPVERKAQLTLRVDHDVLEWFRKRGRGYQTQINALLRAYMEAHK
jgi:uncharacterized DUF497 family protein